MSKYIYVRIWLVFSILAFCHYAVAAGRTCFPDQPVPQYIALTVPHLVDIGLNCPVDVPLPELCYPSSPPIVTLLDNRSPQSLIIEADPPPPDDPPDPNDPSNPVAKYSEVYIWAQQYNEASDSWTDVWTHHSKDAVQKAIADNHHSIVFGATGLLPGKRYRFSIGWCRQGTDHAGCNCYSDPGLWGEAQPTVFPDRFLAPPVPTQLEDTFQRPTTSPKRNRAGTFVGGDGLGPGAFWHDADDHPGFVNGALIASDGTESFVSAPQGTQLQSTQAIPFPHGYAEVLFRPLSTPEQFNPPGPAGKPRNYRVDVRTRATVVAGTTYAYAAQVVYEPDFGSGTTANPSPLAVPEPTIRIFRSADQIPLQLFAQEIKDAGAYNTSTGNGCKLNDIPMEPLSGLDGLKNGGKTLLRLEAVNQNEHPMLKAQVGWDCSDSKCQWLCHWKITDDQIFENHPLFNPRNYQTGLWAHHWDTRIDGFRAGSQPETP